MHSPTELAEKFREKQLKLTPQRQLLFGLLHQNDSHPSAESLFELASKQMPGISLRTVYQTLGELAEMGELQLVDVGTGAKRFDPNMTDHHHFVCESCGAVRDVEIAAKPKMRGGSGKFVISQVGVVFHGRCETCVPTSKRSPAQQAKK
ncbi:MAG: Fur family transcriptional regulator [Actinomycetota bacterium]